jgi:hypothetical protein
MIHTLSVCGFTVVCAKFKIGRKSLGICVFTRVKLMMDLKMEIDQAMLLEF